LIALKEIYNQEICSDKLKSEFLQLKEKAEQLIGNTEKFSTCEVKTWPLCFYCKKYIFGKWL